MLSGASKRLKTTGLVQQPLFLTLEQLRGYEPMHQFGPPVTMHFDGPFYVGIGFASHMPTTLDTAVFTNVSLKNAADKLD